MAGRGTRYSPEFVQEALKLVRESGKSRRCVAADLGMCPETLGKWERTYRADGSKRSNTEADAQAEIERLKRELWLANEEREILKQSPASALNAGDILTPWGCGRFLGLHA